MENISILEIITAVVAALNAGWIIYSSWKKNKPEVKKLEYEADTELSEAANINLEGAKISAQILLDRINELKAEIEKEKKIRREQTEAAEVARKEDAEYFRRRIKDLERESRDYRTWAAKLVKQVVEAGRAPVPFVPSWNESDTSFTAIRTDLENPDDK